LRLMDGSLRLLQKDDLDLVLNWRNSKRIRESMFSDSIISKEQHYNWFESLSHNNSIHLIFEYCQRPAGICNFKEIDHLHNKCLWGFYLGEPDLPRGTGILLGFHSLEYAFGIMKIRKLCSQVLANNVTSMNYHIKLGFTEEGVWREHIMKNSEYIDVVNLAQFHYEWQIKRNVIIEILENQY